jgi:hypothetical protein
LRGRGGQATRLPVGPDEAHEARDLRLEPAIPLSLPLSPLYSSIHISFTRAHTHCREHRAAASESLRPSRGPACSPAPECPDSDTAQLDGLGWAAGRAASESQPGPSVPRTAGACGSGREPEWLSTTGCPGHTGATRREPRRAGARGGARGARTCRHSHTPGVVPPPTTERSVGREGE